MNQGVLVGRYVGDILDGIMVKIITSQGKKVEVPIQLSKNILDNVHKLCTLDDVVGIRYSLDNTSNGDVTFVADKVTFLSSKTAGIEGGEEDGTI